MISRDYIYTSYIIVFLVYISSSITIIFLFNIFLHKVSYKYRLDSLTNNFFLFITFVKIIKDALLFFKHIYFLCTYNGGILWGKYLIAYVKHLFKNTKLNHMLKTVHFKLSTVKITQSSSKSPADIKQPLEIGVQKKSSLYFSPKKVHFR